MKRVGTPDRKVWVIGDFPSSTDVSVMSGGMGRDFKRKLEKVGFNLEDIYFTQVLDELPKWDAEKTWFCTKTQSTKNDYELEGTKYCSPELIDAMGTIRVLAAHHHPELIIGLGNLSLLAFTGYYSVGDWRGSEIRLSQFECTYVPTYGLGTLTKKYDWTYNFEQDLRRCFNLYKNGYIKRMENYLVDPSYVEAIRVIDWLTKKADEGILDLGVDIETRYRQITCLGIAWSKTDAICIPFTCHDKPEGYWDACIEEELIHRLRRLLSHKQVRCHGQNFHYDAQYIIRQFGFIPTLGEDTMQLWHTAFPGLQKSLAFISSMVLDKYCYWKDEGKGHAPDPDKEIQYWTYNCKDAARTLELIEPLNEIVDSLGVRTQYEEQKRLVWPCIKMMLRGVRQDEKLRADYRFQLLDMIAPHEQWFMDMTDSLTDGKPLVKKVTKATKPWYRSPTQQRGIFYDIYGMPAQRSRTNKKAKGPTCDDDALKVFAKKEPILAPLCRKLGEYRSMGVFLSTFVNVSLDWDKRMRTSYGIGMAETFRFTSSEDVFYFGGNLQNIPKGNELDE